MRAPRPALALALGLALAAAAGAAAERHGHGEGHGRRHGNPRDLEAYARALLDPARDAWQRPDEVVKALALGPGQSACDVGSGPGYFTQRLSRAVGESGRVWAVDVEPALLAALRDRLAAAGLRNVTPVLAVPDDPLLPPGSCDVVLVVNTYHHFPEGPAYLRRLAAALRPGGRIVNVDFEKRETPMGPPVARRVSREDFRRDAEAAGLEVLTEPELLEHQYVIVLAPRRH